MANIVQQPNNFRILDDAITLVIYRNEDEPFLFNITNSTVEMTLFEDINVPFVTGTIAVVDSASIISLNLMGNERIRVKLWNNEDYQLEKEFVVWNVTNIKRINETTVSYLIHFMEPHGFFNNFLNVSRAFTGNHSDIIQTIANNYLKVDPEAWDVEQSNDNSKVLFPNVRPLQATKMVLDNTTTEFGEPFFFFSSLKEGLHIRSLYSLYRNNEEEPLVFSKTPTVNTDFNLGALHIMDHTPIEESTILGIAREKLIKSGQLVVDPFRNRVSGADYYYIDHFNEKVAANRELEAGPQLDPNFVIDDFGSTLQSLSSENTDIPYYASISTSGIFEDMPALNEDTTIADRFLGVNAEANMLFLEKDSAEISIPGWHMLSQENNSSIGRVISINIPKPDPSMTVNTSDEVIDKKYSGKYLISNVCHKFTFNSTNNREVYIATLRLKRTSSLDSSAAETGGEIQEGIV